MKALESTRFREKRAQDDKSKPLDTYRIAVEDGKEEARTVCVFP